jgi:hypothetical protein
VIDYQDILTVPGKEIEALHLITKCFDAADAAQQQRMLNYLLRRYRQEVSL